MNICEGGFLFGLLIYRLSTPGRVVLKPIIYHALAEVERCSLTFTDAMSTHWVRKLIEYLT